MKSFRLAVAVLATVDRRGQLGDGVGRGQQRRRSRTMPGAPPPASGEAVFPALRRLGTAARTARTPS